MDVKSKNKQLLSGNLEAEGLFPQLRALSKMKYQFEHFFGLGQLPMEAGLILIRGARQMGKSTWLERQLFDSIHLLGPGSSFYLNGDEILQTSKFYDEMKSLCALFPKTQEIRRIFIDEITAIQLWENVIKRLFDEGITRNILIITTGSKALDLHRGTERLPGRKGKLKRSNYLFTPISFNEFQKKCRPHFKENTLIAYLLTGGSPLAMNELTESGVLPEYVIALTRDWVFGECSEQGRSRQLLNWVCHALLTRGGTSVALAKLARESGAANNTVIQGYVQLLTDLLCISTCHPVDSNTGRPIPRKASKYHWVNSLVAVSFHSSRLRSVSDFQSLADEEQGRWFEWLVAQEIWRRAAISGKEYPETQYFWQSQEYELDFMEADKRWIEVKKGTSGPFEFSWFSKILPRHRLRVICNSLFSTESIEGITFEDFLMGA